MPDPRPSPSELAFTCDWRLGFNPRADGKSAVGYLLSWSGCGGLRLSSDIEVWHPTGGGGDILSGPKVECVGIIESLTYGGDNDPLEVTCFVSRESAANVRAKLAQPLSNTKVQCSWCVLDFDGDRKQWYEAAYVRGSGDADANLDAEDGELQLFVERQGVPISNTLDVRVFRMQFTIVPAPNKTTQLQFATGPTIKLVREWGDT